MRRIIQCTLSIISTLYGLGCVEIGSVKAEPPSYQTRTEIDFDKMDVRGSLTDPIPSVYDGIPRYYDTTGIVSSTITPEDAELARSLIKTRLTKTNDILQHWNGDKQYSIDELDWAQVYALYQLMFDTKQTLEERDIRLRSAKETRIVSVRPEPKGLWKISESRTWSPTYPDVPREDLNTLYRFDGFHSQGSIWTEEQISIVADALRVLEPRELNYLSGLTWIRESGDSRTPLAGLFRFENKGDGTTQSITLYDKTFKGLSYSFCGTIDAPYSAAHVVIVHELGHLLSDQPRIAYGNQFNKTVDEYNMQVSRFNQTQDKSILPSINSLQSKIAKMERNPIVGHGPIVEAFLANRSTDKGPTRYADFDDDEAFAESYALFKLDPEALRRIDPPLYQWFASRAYLDMLP
jgi:hypothetical protein